MDHLYCINYFTCVFREYENNILTKFNIFGHHNIIFVSFLKSLSFKISIEREYFT